MQDQAASAVQLRNLQIGDAGWLIAKHGELYAREAGFDASFEGLVARIMGAFIQDHDPARERGWIAERDGARLGCVFCVDGGGGMAKLRLFLLLPEARGLGLGHKLLEAVLEFAKASGYRGLRLWTHESHRAACALYEKHGLKVARSAKVRSFGCDLVEQTWEITF